MPFITRDYHGNGLGNQLLMYTYARLQVENNPNLGPLISKPITGFPGTSDKVGNPNGTETVEWKQYDFWDTGGTSYKSYRDHKKNIQKFLRFKQAPPQPEDKLLIHIRIGDFLDFTSIGGPPSEYGMFIPPIDVYYKIIKIDKPSTVCLVTDSPYHQMVKKLKIQTQNKLRIKCDVISEDALHDFSFLASANRLCIAHSTFSWCAGWLGRAKRIYCPTLSGQYYPGHSLSALWVDNESRYKKVDI